MTKAIIITAYNAPHLLHMQLPAIRKYCNDVDIVILDNSTREYRDRVYSIAAQHHCIYHPMKAGNGDPSRHHASALNWAVDNVLPSYDSVLFLDHDIVPFKEVEWPQVLAWCGVHQVRDDMHYTHPGFTYINKSFSRQFPINFMPSSGLDTGGRMHHFSLRMTFCPVSEYQGFEIYDNTWLHMTKGCNWDKASDYDSRLKRFKNAVKDLSQ